MAATVKIPTQLRAATGGEAEVEVSGGTVGEVLDAVEEADVLAADVDVDEPAQPAVVVGNAVP